MCAGTEVAKDFLTPQLKSWESQANPIRSNLSVTLSSTTSAAVRVRACRCCGGRTSARPWAGLLLGPQLAVPRSRLGLGARSPKARPLAPQPGEVCSGCHTVHCCLRALACFVGTGFLSWLWHWGGTCWYWFLLWARDCISVTGMGSLHCWTVDEGTCMYVAAQTLCHFCVMT